jgi:tetratricopeptide (TPR) repeat protein
LTAFGSNLPPEMQLDLVDSHIRWADVLKELNELGKAEDLLERAVQIARDCAARHSQGDRWQIEVLRGLAALGRLQFYKQDVDSALEILVPAAALAEHLERRGSSSEIWRDVLDAFYFDLGFALSQELIYSKPSDRIREQALSWIRRQLERAPDDVRLGWWLAGFYLHRFMLLVMEDITGAKDAARQALELAAKLPVEEEEDADLKRRIEALRAFVPKKPQRPRRAKR